MTILPAILLATVTLSDTSERVVREIREEQHAHETHIVLMGPTDYNYSSPDSRTIVIELVGWVLTPTSEFQAKSAAIASVTMSQRREAPSPPTATVTVRLSADVPYRLQAQDDSVRLILEDAGRPLANVAVAAATPAPTAAPSAAVEATPAPTESVALPAASRLVVVSGEERQGQVAITARFDGRATHKAFRLGTPARVVIDFSDVRLAAGFTPPVVKAGSVRGVRVSQFTTEPRVVRLVVDLESRVPYEIVDDGLAVTILVGGPG
jgi:hypothetical protein